MENPVHIGARIADLRDLKQMSQSDLARKVGVTPQAVQKWEAGASDPRVTKIPSIASALGVTVESLLDGTEFFRAALAIEKITEEMERRNKNISQEKYPLSLPGSFEEREIIRKERNRFVHGLDSNRSSGIASVRTHALPLISWVQAGEWSEIVNSFAATDAEDWLPVPFNHGPEAFCLRVIGESMYNPGGEKSYSPGEFIAVDPMREPVNRSMVVVRLDDEKKATFKQLIVDPDGTKMLKALNPNWPKQFIEINGNATIVGVVIGKWTPE